MFAEKLFIFAYTFLFARNSIIDYHIAPATVLIESEDIETIALKIMKDRVVD